MTPYTNEILGQRVRLTSMTTTPIFWPPKAKTIMKIKEEKYLRRPRPMKASSTIFNKIKYCWFHYNHDHDIEKCIQLKDEIKALI